ncbi:alpha-2 adrenergic receptor [Trichonephila clavipes]|nr:alpha-2 adrenergic receptor [Trichonephila clavipes]
MKIENNGNLVLGPFDESTPCLMIVLMNCQTKPRINHLTAVKSIAILESNANLNFSTWKKKHSIEDIQLHELLVMQWDLKCLKSFKQVRYEEGSVANLFLCCCLYYCGSIALPAYRGLKKLYLHPPPKITGRPVAHKYQDLEIARSPLSSALASLQSCNQPAAARSVFVP